LEVKSPRKRSQTDRRLQVKVVIMGCGRVGSTLAAMMDQAGHRVTVIDSNSDSFRRLTSDFKGEKIIGNAIDEEVLRRASIEAADAFVAVTNGDNRNIMACQIAREIFNVKKVVCRIYDPIRESTYREMGMETFCPTLVGAQILFSSLTGSKKEVF